MKYDRIEKQIVLQAPIARVGLRSAIPRRSQLVRRCLGRPFAAARARKPYFPRRDPRWPNCRSRMR